MRLSSGTWIVSRVITAMLGAFSRGCMQKVGMTCGRHPWDEGCLVPLNGCQLGAILGCYESNWLRYGDLAILRVDMECVDQYLPVMAKETIFRYPLG